MAKKILICALSECNNEFEPKVHNQRFCSKACTRVFTNRKILEAYHENKNKDLKGRVCNEGECGTILSIYNPGNKCGVHERLEHISSIRDWDWLVDESDSEL